MSYLSTYGAKSGGEATNHSGSELDSMTSNLHPAAAAMICMLEGNLQCDPRLLSLGCPPCLECTTNT